MVHTPPPRGLLCCLYAHGNPPCLRGQQGCRRHLQVAIGGHDQVLHASFTHLHATHPPRPLLLLALLALALALLLLALLLVL